MPIVKSIDIIAGIVCPVCKMNNIFCESLKNRYLIIEPIKQKIIVFCVSGENGTSSSYDPSRPSLHPNGIHTSANSSSVNGFPGNKEDDLDNCSDEELSDMMDQSSDNSLDSVPYSNHVSNTSMNHPHVAMS